MKFVLCFAFFSASLLADTVRVATFNASLQRNQAGALITDCNDAQHPQVMAAAKVIREINADVLLVNEFDYDADGRAALAFLQIHLKNLYPHYFIAPVNTGVPSGKDLNGDGDTSDPEDCFGYGRHPGQYGMLLLSRYPIEKNKVRTFQKFLWKNMPENLLPKTHYGDAADHLRLSHQKAIGMCPS